QIPAVGFETALADLTGESFETLLVNWERWLFSTQAEQAVIWTLYSPLTATPLPSATRTPVPPTRTATAIPSATPTRTPTPTATSRVFQVPSPLPSYTPFTPIAPTPSNTPRPPGSLDESPPGGGGGICPAALPALLLPGLALVIGGRRKWR
ncbi:MAG: hypothetical protein JW910_21545, partial [Anaerolineae bacterium]|nr:hypothetical protein [Anaerolineae bacterium]